MITPKDISWHEYFSGNQIKEIRQCLSNANTPLKEIVVMMAIMLDENEVEGDKTKASEDK